MHYDYLIVGSGLYAATFAYFARKKGKHCLVIDKRPVLGGNVYCEEVEGIRVHKYGAHIFHTSNKEVWDLVNSIVPFNRYTNSPVANYKGQLYNLPFNMNTFHQMWGVLTPDEAMQKIDEQRQTAIRQMKEQGFTEPCNLEQQTLMLVGSDIYERLVKGYTEKQWGRSCTELPPFIIRRLPVRMVFDNNYFNDLYQGIPIGGYNALIDGLLDGVETRTSCDFHQDREHWTYLVDKVLYTGMIDEFFDFRFGPLEYRSVRFETNLLPTPNYQGNAVVNYTDSETPYTRIIEHKHFEMFGDTVYQIPHTVVTKEYSTEWYRGIDPYYPVNDVANNQRYQQYKDLADHAANTLFGGRLAEYRYYDMDDVMEAAMKMAKKVLK